MTLEFACAYGHVITARDLKGAVDLEGHFCPVCMGGIVGASNTLEPRLLAPVQEELHSEQG